MNFLRKVFTPKTRALIYALSGLFHGFALVYFQVTEDTWQLWTSMGLGLFDAILAFSNTPGVTNKVKEDPA